MTSNVKLSTEFDRKLLKRPDGFYSMIHSGFEKISKNSTHLGIGLLVIVVVAMGVGFYLNKKEAQEAEAQNHLFIAQKALDDQLKKIAESLVPVEPEKKIADTVKAQPEAKKPPKREVSSEEVLFKKINIDAQLNDPITKMKDVAQRYAGTRAGYEALFGIGSLYFRHGLSEKSIEWFQKAAEAAPNALDKALAISSQAYAYENSGQFNEALTFYEKTLNAGEKSLRADTLFSMARVNELIKQKDRAKALYDQIISEFTETEYARNAELYKSLIE